MCMYFVVTIEYPIHAITDAERPKIVCMYFRYGCTEGVKRWLPAGHKMIRNLTPASIPTCTSTDMMGPAVPLHPAPPSRTANRYPRIRKHIKSVRIPARIWLHTVHEFVHQIAAFPGPIRHCLVYSLDVHCVCRLSGRHSAICPPDCVVARDNVSHVRESADPVPDTGMARFLIWQFVQNDANIHHIRINP